MVAFNVVERFRNQNDLRTYRRKLAHEITQSFTYRLLPALSDLPIDLVDATGARCSLSAALQRAPHVALYGVPGSGRWMAIQQWALRWTAGEETVAGLPVLLSLPQIDDGVESPDKLIASQVNAALQAAETKPAREVLPFFRRNTAAPPAPEQLAGYLLCVQGWEDLPTERRAAWRAALLAAIDHNPIIRLVVALPRSEPAWPAFTAFEIAPTTPALLNHWIERAVSAEHRARVLAKLAPDGSLQALSERLFEIALLTGLGLWPSLPRTRADLYAQALAKLLGLQLDQLPLHPSIAELQLLAAYDERPAKIATNLLVRGANSTLHFAHSQFRRYLAARQLVAEERYDLLQSIEPDERHELAPLIVAMIDEPARLYKVLWRSDDLRAEDVLALGRCLREAPLQSPSWALRIIAALALLVRDGPANSATQARQLLQACMPTLDASLVAAANADDPAHRFLTRLFDLLPTDLAIPRLMRLVYSGLTPELFAWSLADILLNRATPEEHIVPPPDDQRALARWIYIQALGSPAARQQLEPVTVVAALHSLATSLAGDTRQLRVAGALLDDPDQPVATRLAALALLTGNSQPAALTMIERASQDQNAEVRRSALEAINQHDPERALVALGRAALEQGAPQDVRLRAIQRLGEHIARGSGRLLIHCAGDSTLALYARIQSVGALGHDKASMQQLIQIVEDSSGHPEVRAAAARQLGAVGHHEALTSLLPLLDNLSTPPALTLGLCESLGELGDREASGSLLRTLDRAAADVNLTLAAVRAIGRIGDPEASEPLSRLLGAGALDRLQRQVEPRLLQQPAEISVNDPGLPAASALRLELALAKSLSAAERPTTLSEFLAAEADQVRVAAAQALATIGGNTARAALLATLLDNAAGSACGAIVDALVEVEGSSSADALGYLLDAEEVNPLTRWLVVQRLIEHPAGEESMQRLLARPSLDTFTRGALVEGLGQRRASTALPLLQQIAEDSNSDPYLRSQAVLALGLLGNPASEITLIHLVRDPSEDVALRGLAAEHLPERLSNEGRRFLRDLLRNEQPPAPIVAGALRALGRARDREALPLMLRYCLDELTPVTQAAIAALIDLGDASVAPMLVRIAQLPNADAELRLQAVGALLRIGGDGYRPLLRAYLEQGALPLRLQALEYVIAADTPAPELLAMLADQAQPLPLRLGLIEYFTASPAAIATLLHILEDPADELQLRALTLRALSPADPAVVTPSLVRLVEHPDTPDPLRIRCLDTLQELETAAAWAIVSQLAEGEAQPPALRASALAVLRRQGLHSSANREKRGEV